MTRIVLVEDEPLFRKGLAKMIAGSSTSWTVCGEADNGQEAERLIADCQPDLVITDIRMPIMDGLELLKRVKARFSHIEFIVITGYQDFQYAQTALRHGALDLLVKPCGKSDIDEALLKVDALLADRQAQARKMASEHQLRLESALRSVFLRLPYSAELLPELERAVVGGRLVVFQIADFFPAHKQFQKQDVPLLQFAVLNIIGEMLDNHALSGTLLLIEAGRFGLLLQPTAQEQHFCDAVCGTIGQLLGLSVRAWQAGVVPRLLQLPDMYEAAAAEARTPSPADRGSGGVVGGTSASDGREGRDAFPINRARQQLISAQTVAFITAGQSEALRTYLDEIVQEIVRYGVETDAWKIEALSLSFGLLDTARKQLESVHDPKAMTERINKLHECRTTEEAGHWLAEETDSFLRAFQEWQRKHSASAINRAVRYIEEHFAEPLSLQQVASHIHLNAAYFSHLFKKETGRSFVQFLIDLRMERAKQLLSNTDMNVTEVSGVVGYDLPNYFAKLFKQATGCSPKEYRKLYQS